MPDKYSSFSDLACEESSADYQVSLSDIGSDTIVVAPHGGDIEPGTSELCREIAAKDFSWYVFEGRKLKGNRDLHITSTRFDEPRCRDLIGRANMVITIHGEGSDSDAVFLGGLHEPKIDAIKAALESAGFIVLRHEDENLQGRSAANICNRGLVGKGVQLEIARGLRKTMFAGLAARQRDVTTPRFNAFCECIRRGLSDSTQ